MIYNYIYIYTILYSTHVLTDFGTEIHLQLPTWALGLDGAQHLQLCATAPADVAEDRQLLEVLSLLRPGGAGAGLGTMEKRGKNVGKTWEKRGKMRKNAGKLGKVEEKCM